LEESPHECDNQPVADALTLPDGVTAHLGNESFAPLDPTSPQYLARVAFDRARLSDIVATVIERVPTGRVLDLGAAPFIVTSSLVSLGYDVTVNGLPIRELDVHGELELGICGSTRRLPVELFDVEGVFPLPDNMFDCVIAGEIFEHLNRQPWAMLSESWRVLKPGGLLVITTPNGHTMEVLYWWLKRGSTGQGFNPVSPTVRHAREYSVSEIEDIVVSQGFDIRSIFTRNYSHIGENGFPGLFGPVKRAIHRHVLQAAEHGTGVLSNRAQTIVVVAHRSERSPDLPPTFMRYGGTDERSGFNFDATTE
jgi:SAM-dependent methyltransferase